MHKLIFLSLIILILSSCSQNEIIIENNTSQVYHFQLDKDQYTIAKDTFLTFKLNNGNHVFRKDSITKTASIHDDGILNPSNAVYIVWTDLYTEEFDKYKEKLNLKNLVTVNEKEYENVDFEIYTDFFIPKSWDYRLNESFPEEITIEKEYEIKSKVFSVEELEKDWGYLGDINFNDKNIDEISSYIDSVKNYTK